MFTMRNDEPTLPAPIAAITVATRKAFAAIPELGANERLMSSQPTSSTADQSAASLPPESGEPILPVARRAQ